MRIKLSPLLIIGFVFFVFVSCLFKNPKNPDTMIPFDNGKKYAKYWHEVDSLEQKGLPKSALEVVETIYRKAKEDNNSEQIVKSWIFRMKYKNSLEENAFETLVWELDTIVAETPEPSKSFMHMMLADMYWMFYQSNRWKFQQRTETVDFEQKDIQTWSLNKLIDTIIKHYIESVQSKEILQESEISLFKELISTGNLSEKLRPTLYDFLSQKAIQFLSNTELSLNRPADKFELKEGYYFAPAKEFANTDIKTSDTLSMHFYAIQLMQELLKFRLDDDNTAALIDADLLRLSFVWKHSVNDQKDSLYLSALKHLQDKHEGHEFSGEILYQIALFYNSKSGEYDPDKEISHQYKQYRAMAHDICQDVKEKFPKSDAATKCHNLLVQILLPELTYQSENVVSANEKFAVRVKYRNIDTIHVRVASISRKKHKALLDKSYKDSYLRYDDYLKYSAQVYTELHKLPVDKDYNSHSVELLLKKLPLGRYFIVVSDNAKFTYSKHLTSFSFVDVSNLSYIERTLPDGALEQHVLHRSNGAPQQNVTAKTWIEEYNYKKYRYERKKGKEYTTDAQGYFKIDPPKKNSRNVYVEYSKGDDFLDTDNAKYLYWRDLSTRPHTYLSIFTDRAIYRPGQTIHFKGLCYTNDNEKLKIEPGRAMNVQLLDVNQQKVHELLLTTNEYGTISGSFQIPLGLLTGTFRIQVVSLGEKTIRVEEYKRPKFEVEMHDFKGNYMLNDEVSVKGFAKTYAGSNLTGAKVSYRIVRKPRWIGWWYYYFPQHETEIQHGELVTDDSGEFTIDFKALPDLSLGKNNNICFNYAIYVDVTDINGETQSTQANLTVGYVGLKVNLRLNEYLDKTKDHEISILTENLNGEFVPVEGKISIYKLKKRKTYYRERKWEKPDKQFYTEEEWEKEYPNNVYDEENNIRLAERDEKQLQTEFNTKDSKKLQLKKLKKWKQGSYVAEITSQDAFGNKVKSEKYFTLFNPDTEKLPVKDIHWHTSLNNFCEVGETASFLIGSAAKDVQVLYEIEHQGKIIKKKWLSISEKQKRIDIPVREEYRGNFGVHFAFVHKNRTYFSNSIVYVPYSNKQLDIKFATFRDKLQPGQEDEWQIKIKGPKGDKVLAEMLATLYDASLDVFAQNYWPFSIYRSYYLSLGWGSASFNTRYATLYQREAFPLQTKYIYQDYSNFNWFGFHYYQYNYFYKSEGAGLKRKSGGKRSKALFSIADDGADMDDEFEVSSEEAVDMKVMQPMAEASRKEDKPAPAPPGGKKRNGDDEKEAAPDEAPSQDFSDVKVRTNFNETAFFYPHLVSDKDGVVTISFSIPESLTRWKMMGFAHTKDLKYGFVNNELVTQKDLMLMPNVPRFFRENDKMDFQVKIASLAEKTLNGSAKLEFTDAITGEQVDLIKGKDELPFSVEAGKNTVVSWPLNIPEGLGAVQYKVVAKAGNFSDGEQNVVPVLTNRMLVTESMPMPVRGGEKKDFTFEKLINSNKSSTIKHQKLTLEFTSNPAWYAVQALPYVMEYPYECSEQTFSRFYANSIATHLVNSAPKVKKVFDSWANTPKSEALLSNLEKNQELKSLLLEETPWVLNAQNETERKRNIAVLFDLNRMSHELNKALKKLIKAQSANGGWPWFDGMPESWYITEHIVAGMGHLDVLGVKDVRENNKVWNMVKKGVAYLDYCIKKEYDDLKKYYSKKELEEDHLSHMAVHYLYTRSYFKDIDIPGRTQEALKYFKGQAEKYWLDKGLYKEGMIALALHRYDNKKTAQDIIRSLKEFSLHDDELGMYWKNNISGWFWYQAPIETQALLIEAFDEVTDDKKFVDDMKVWLLKQKQTQDWKTTKATVEAVYALMKRGANWLAADELVKITMNNTVIDPTKMDDVQVEAGTGYFKTSWNKTEIKPEMGHVTVEKTTEGIAWGALYWQYFEQLDKITPHETPLKLKKELFIERKTDRGPVIEPIKNKAKIMLGDKIIVRIELRVDRDMEYIHMKDMRASGFEPINVLSTYKYQDGLGYYESTRDAATNFFISYLRKGTYVFEYPLRASQTGDFSNGITTIQSMYAPEFTSHSEGIRVKIE